MGVETRLLGSSERSRDVLDALEEVCGCACGRSVLPIPSTSSINGSSGDCSTWAWPAALYKYSAPDARPNARSLRQGAGPVGFVSQVLFIEPLPMVEKLEEEIPSKLHRSTICWPPNAH
jgi:hypothetical protein